MTRQQAIGFLAAAGTRDPDVLYARKLILLAGAARGSGVGAALLVLGAVLTATATWPRTGIAIAVAGWLVRSRAVRRMAVVEAAFRDYLA